jgi:hypothetical protein
VRRLLAPAAAVLALAACSRDSPEACFEPDTDYYSFALVGDTGFVFRWTSGYMPVRLYAEPTGDLPQNVAEGLNLWAGAFRCGEFSGRLVSDSNAADIIIRNPPVLPPASRTGAVLAADSVGACRGRTDGDTITTDDNVLRIAGPIRAYVTPLSSDPAAVAACYRFVTAHEIGHTLGILSHSLDPDDLMYSVPRRRELTPRDRLTIQVLYHTTPAVAPPLR